MKFMYRLHDIAYIGKKAGVIENDEEQTSGQESQLPRW